MPTFAYRRIDQGELQGLTLIPVTGTVPWAALLATIGIMRGGEGHNLISNIFIHDYVSEAHFPFWNGKYNFMTGDVLFLRSISSGIYGLRLAATVYREEDT